MLNRVILRGYVADEPFIRATEGGKFVRIRMITIEKIRLQKTGGIRRHTEWHTISLWGKEAETADQTIRPGAAIEVEGTLRSREWQDKDGITHRTTEISANKLKILDSIDGYDIPDFIMKIISSKRNSSNPPQVLEVKKPIEDADNLPF
ncbi:MAG: single-stranded DNA-binding protein [Rikenellaceae bacterium]